MLSNLSCHGGLAQVNLEVVPPCNLHFQSDNVFRQSDHRHKLRAWTYQDLAPVILRHALDRTDLRSFAKRYFYSCEIVIFSIGLSIRVCRKMAVHFGFGLVVGRLVRVARNLTPLPLRLLPHCAGVFDVNPLAPTRIPCGRLCSTRGSITWIGHHCCRRQNFTRGSPSRL